MNRKPSELTLAAVSLVCILILAACNCAPTLRYITISPATSTILSGTTQQYTATGYYSNGSITPNLSVTWASSSTSVATIDAAAGVATGVASGTTSITAYALGITSNTVTLNVNQVTAIVVTPATATVAAGATQQFQATGSYKNFNGTTSTGTAGDLTNEVAWASSKTAFATIMSSSDTTPGLATGVAAGTTTISATLGAATGSATLTVGPPAPISLVITPATPTIAVGNSILLTAMEMWSNNTTHTPSGTVTWVSDTPADANVIANSSSTALAAGFAAGAPNITASETISAGTFTGTLPLTVVTGTTHFAYVSNSGTSSTNPWSIGEYSVNATTSPYLTSTGTVTLAGYSPSQTVLNPNGQYLYLISTSNGTFATVYDINATTGALTLSTTATQQVAGQGCSNTGVVDPYGRFFYVIDDGSATCSPAPANPLGTIYGFTISQTDGSLTPISAVTAYTTNLNAPESVMVDRTGKYLYVVNYDDGTATPGFVSAYSIDQTTGALTPLTSGATINAGIGAYLATMDPAGKNIYVANNTDGTVSSFSVGSGGVLTNTATTTVTGAQAVLNVAVSPNDKYLYVLDGGVPPANGALYGFTITSGVPSSTPIGPAVATGEAPTGMAIDPTGTILAVDNAGPGGTSPGEISIYTIGSTGALTAKTPVAAGISPYFVTFLNAP
jgi:6-phosphogluconolactonase (cycloisomerase 2 family)